MLDETVALPEDPEELRAFTARLLAEVKAQAVLIEKPPDQRRIRPGRPLHEMKQRLVLGRDPRLRGRC